MFTRVTHGIRAEVNVARGPESTEIGYQPGWLSLQVCGDLSLKGRMRGGPSPVLGRELLEGGWV